ncbi:discoidin domain-containing protein [Paenibacillus pasadenensis]|uniref:discoidin domain-containing protein n=1 Tax=Paenibacillus pasadenensis TaxID=217090 RepID=UPI00203CAE34|nr:discoidin domain-containing protein [Paenibacillus pasadenensis]MCM3747525.1 discoidin domain-containing protein [Paenibacillus pasadenensis]
MINSMNRFIAVKLAALLLFVSVLALLPAQKPVQANATLLSQGKPVTALNSEAGNGPELANDADSSNNGYWGSVITDERKKTWWQIDLEGQNHISQIVVRNYVDGTRFYQYHIVGSMDGVNWNPIAIKGGNSAASNGGDVYNVSVAARYIRVIYTLGSANGIAHMTDFKAYGHPVSTMQTDPQVKLQSASLDKVSYSAGDTVKLNYQLKNNSPSYSYNITSVKAKVIGLTSPYNLFVEQQVAANVNLSPGQTYTGSNISILNIDNMTALGSYALHVQYNFSDGSSWESYQTFFRIKNTDEKYVYSVARDTYNGLPVYKLDGDMSAGVAVEKAAESIGAGTSQMWNTNGGMLTSIHATPSFLVDSVQQTVDFYDQEFGSSTVFDTVIIGTGSFGAPYLSKTLNAPFLPTHFLVSADTVQEIKSVHDYSRKQGLSVYSMFGADASVNEGVAWIELLDLPPAYVDFLQNHQVKNIVFVGAKGNGGESLVKKVLTADSQPGPTQNGDIYLGFNFAGVSATQNLINMNTKIKDFNSYSLGSFENLKDWESGILTAQFNNYISTASSSVPTLNKIDSVISGLWEMASHSMLSYFKKNNIPLEGVSINPYMSAHPFYETKKGYVPFLMLQWGTNVNQMVDQNLNVKFRAIVNSYFPSVTFDDLTFRINFARNAGNNDQPPVGGLWLSDQIKNRLTHNGLNDVKQNTNEKTAFEVWDVSDGMNSPSEEIAVELTTMSTAAQLKTWNESLEPLTLDELEDIQLQDTAIIVEQNYTRN